MLFPDIFIQEAFKFDGVEDVVFNSNGSFYVLYQGQGYLIVPNFEVQHFTTEQPIKPSIVINTDGTLTYTVAMDVQQLISTIEVMVFRPFVEPVRSNMYN